MWLLKRRFPGSLRRAGSPFESPFVPIAARPHRRTPFAFLAIGLTALICAQSSAGERQESKSIDSPWRLRPAKDSNLSPTAGVHYEREADVDVRQLRDAQTGDQIELQIGDLESMIAIVHRRIDRRSDRFVLSGSLSDDARGTFILAVNGNVLAAHICSPRIGTYRMRTKPGERHALQTVFLQPPRDCLSSKSRFEIDLSEPVIRGSCGDGSVINVLVVYTDAAAVAAGGTAAMDALIDMEVEYNNVAYINSLINTTWNLVYTRRLDVADNGLTLESLTDPNDGLADGVHALRDAYGADQVAAFIPGPGGVANGLFSLDPSEAALMFCLNGTDAPVIVLSHEIGHNLGCCHALGQGGGCPPEGGLLFPFSNGHTYVGNSGVFDGTVMAGGSIPHFSNPNVNFDGQPTGIAEGAVMDHPGAENARTINLSALAVSNFRCNDGVCEALDLPSDAPDCDDNGVPDLCDIARGVLLDINVNGVPDVCEGIVPGDFDGDGDVDLSDFAQFSLCFGGPNTPPAASCPAGIDADFDNDGDVDLGDFATLSLNFTGPL